MVTNNNESKSFENKYFPHRFENRLALLQGVDEGYDSWRRSIVDENLSEPMSENIYI